MQTLQLTPELAKELYPSASKEWKAVLTVSFGEKFFKTKKTFSEIQTLEDVFEATGEDSLNIKYTTGEPNEIAYRLLKLLGKALNPEGWKPNWNDSKQKKWRPWFWMDDNPGFRFCGSVSVNTNADAGAGSGLVFASQEISDHAGKCFLDIYKAFMM